jgi:hypothetical protein
MASIKIDDFKGQNNHDDPVVLKPNEFSQLYNATSDNNVLTTIQAPLARTWAIPTAIDLYSGNGGWNIITNPITQNIILQRCNSTSLVIPANTLITFFAYMKKSAAYTFEARIYSSTGSVPNDTPYQNVTGTIATVIPTGTDSEYQWYRFLVTPSVDVTNPWIGFISNGAIAASGLVGDDTNASGNVYVSGDGGSTWTDYATGYAGSNAPYFPTYIGTAQGAVDDYQSIVLPHPLSTGSNAATTGLSFTADGYATGCQVISERVSGKNTIREIRFCASSSVISSTKGTTTWCVIAPQTNIIRVGKVLAFSAPGAVSCVPFMLTTPDIDTGAYAPLSATCLGYNIITNQELPYTATVISTHYYSYLNLVDGLTYRISTLSPWSQYQFVIVYNNTLCFLNSTSDPSEFTYSLPGTVNNFTSGGTDYLGLGETITGVTIYKDWLVIGFTTKIKAFTGIPGDGTLAVISPNNGISNPRGFALGENALFILSGHHIFVYTGAWEEMFDMTAVLREADLVRVATSLSLAYDSKDRELYINYAPARVLVYNFMHQFWRTQYTPSTGGISTIFQGLESPVIQQSNFYQLNKLAENVGNPYAEASITTGWWDPDPDHQKTTYQRLVIEYHPTSTSVSLVVTVEYDDGDIVTFPAEDTQGVTTLLKYSSYRLAKEASRIKVKLECSAISEPFSITAMYLFFEPGMEF